MVQPSYGATSKASARTLRQLKQGALRHHPAPPNGTERPSAMRDHGAKAPGNLLRPSTSAPRLSPRHHARLRLAGPRLAPAAGNLAACGPLRPAIRVPTAGPPAHAARRRHVPTAAQPRAPRIRIRIRIRTRTRIRIRSARRAARRGAARDR
jgi:hypothetical protein